MFKNIKKIDENTVTFTLGPETIGFANAIKRIFKAHIPVVAFDPDQIKTIINKSSLRNELIEHRIAMLPVDNTKLKKGEDIIEFELNVTNARKDYQLIDVLGKDLVPKGKRETFFSPNFLIMQLKPGQQLAINAKTKLFNGGDIANRNACHIWYDYDDTKQVSKGKYHFQFTLESYDTLPTNELMKHGTSAVKNTFQWYLDNLDNPDITKIDEKIGKIVFQTIDPHSIGNVLVQYIMTEPEYIDKLKCGYKQPHPTLNECHIKLLSLKGSVNVRDIIEKSLKALMKKVR